MMFFNVEMAVDRFSDQLDQFRIKSNTGDLVAFHPNIRIIKVELTIDTF